VTPKLNIALSAEAALGEGPTWDPASGRLLWVDILSSEVHSLDPETGADEVASTPQHVGAAKPRHHGGLVLNLRDGVGLVDSGGAFRWLVEWPEEGCRGNDAAIDADGRLWAGTMRYDSQPGGGRLRRVDPAGQVTEILKDVAVSNGIGWSPDRSLMYYVDTPTRQIDLFDVVPDTGLVTGRRAFVAMADVAGFPDGLTVDADGCVWVALWEGAAVHRYTPTGRLDLVVEVPVSQPTACAFGGTHLRDLYITTARAGLDAAALAREPLAGSVLVVPDAGVGQQPTPFAG
jgi:sugar lactone lactonase YvrE